MDYILLSRPLKGQLNDCIGTITVGQDIQKIQPDEYGNGFDGGPFPSRTLETYTFTPTRHDGKDWHTETLPLSKESVTKCIKDRLCINTKASFTFNVGEEYTNPNEDWAYAIIQS